MLESIAIQEKKVICYRCHHEIDTLITVKKFKIVNKNGYWEAKYDNDIKFYCSYCKWEIDIDRLGIKKVIF